MSNAIPSALVLRQGREFTSTAYRRSGANNDIVQPIPGTFQARMRFAPRYDGSDVLLLTSSPAAGLTINYAAGSIAIYIGATLTAALNANVKLVWDLEMYDPVTPDSVIFLGSGTAVVEPKVP